MYSFSSKGCKRTSYRKATTVGKSFNKLVGFEKIRTDVTTVNDSTHSLDPSVQARRRTVERSKHKKLRIDALAKRVCGNLDDLNLANFNRNVLSCSGNWLWSPCQWPHVLSRTWPWITNIWKRLKSLTKRMRSIMFGISQFWKLFALSGIVVDLLEGFKLKFILWS